jgi:hypothetical protein
MNKISNKNYNFPFPVIKMDRSAIILIFVLSLLLPFSCAYDCYNGLVEADFLTLGQKYEAPDIDNLLIDKKNLTGDIPQPLFSFVFLEGNFCLNFSLLALLNPVVPLAYILRC